MSDEFLDEIRADANDRMDKSVEAQVLNLLGELKSRFNLTYLFISHDLSVVRAVSNRIMVLYLGRIVELADGETVCGSPLA